MLKALRPSTRPLARARSGRIPSTLIACLTWLSNVVQFVKCVGGSSSFVAGELHPRFRKCQRHPLILDGHLDLRRDSACTFYLVFKEPEALSRGRAWFCTAAAPAYPHRAAVTNRFLGNLLRLLPDPAVVNP